MMSLKISPHPPIVDPAARIDPPEPVLSVRELTVAYDNETAIDRVSFEVDAGDRVAIIGPNGAGKSTLIQTMMGLLRAQSGSVIIAGSGAQRLGYVPQHEGVNWDFPVTVRDAVMMGLVGKLGWLRWPGRSQWQRVEMALTRVGLEQLADRQVGELSGGQRRRVFIARALVQAADILILDEPFSGVDTNAQSNLMDTLERLNRDGITVILSTHDLNLAFQRFDKVMALRQRLIAYGAPDAVYTPDTLAQLYGGRLATWDDGRQVTVFLDDHNCDDC
jgi:ABC-type Mn2+/Zn2+ transport system ATPase subunit